MTVIKPFQNKDVEQFRAQCESTKRDFEVVVPPSLPYHLAEQLCRIFDVRMYCCSNFCEVGVTDFNCVFIAVPEHSMQHPLWVAGHEVWHMMQHRFPDVVQTFQSTAMSNILPEAIQRRKDIEDDKIGDFLRELATGVKFYSSPSSDEKIINEIFSDVFGNMWCDQRFWRGLSGYHGPAVEALLHQTISFLEAERPASYREWYIEKDAALATFVPITNNLLRAPISSHPSI